MNRNCAQTTKVLHVFTKLCDIRYRNVMNIIHYIVLKKAHQKVKFGFEKKGIFFGFGYR